MSDPQPVPERKTPPRAEPIQPDRPGRGTDKAAVHDLRGDGTAQDATQAGGQAVTGGGAQDNSSDASVTGNPSAAKQQKEQTEQALKNVRDGYG